MAGKSNGGSAEMTAAEAARRVRRPVVEKAKDGTLVTKQVAVGADEVLAFRDYGDHVRVVTVDGQKFDSREA